MNFVKKNIVSLVCALIAVVAIVAAFWPLGGYYEDLQAGLDKSKDRFTKVSGLLKKPRKMPVIEPGQNPVALTVFPGPGVIKAVNEQQSGLRSESHNILAEAVRGNMAEFALEGRTIGTPDLNTFNPTDKAVQNAMVLTPGSLPSPDSNAPFAFQKALEQELKRVREVVLKGGMPPGQVDIDKAEKALRLEKDKDLQFTDKDKPALNQAQVDADFEDARAKIPAQLREQAAGRYMVYVEPGVFEIDPSIRAGTLTKEQIWYAQVALWVQEDVARAIRETNLMPRPDAAAPAVDVTESLVKRIARFDVSLGPDMYQRSGAASGGGMAPRGGLRGGGGLEGGADPGGGGGAEAVAGGGELPKFMPQVSATGRSCNALYDVVHFTIVVDIDARATQLFLNQLSRGRLISVRKVDLTRPDLTDAATFGYIYSRGNGTPPVIQMAVDCEALLLREWTVPLMPTGAAQQKSSIREMLGVPATFAPVLAPPPPQPK